MFTEQNKDQFSTDFGFESSLVQLVYHMNAVKSHIIISERASIRHRKLVNNSKTDII